MKTQTAQTADLGFLLVAIGLSILVVVVYAYWGEIVAKVMGAMMP